MKGRMKASLSACPARAVRLGGLVAVPLRSATAAPGVWGAAVARRKSAPQRKRHCIGRGPAPAPASPTTLAVAVRDANVLPAFRPVPAHAHAHLPAKRRKHVCPDCHKTFLWSTHLKRHMNAHRRKESTCVVADEFLLQKMQSVLRSMHGTEESPPPQPAKAIRTPASPTTVSTSSSEMRKRSLPPVEGESKDSSRASARRPHAKGYICPVCHKVFPWLCVLKSHIQSHSDVQVYKCNKCDFMTTIPHALTEHLFSHIEQKPVKCQECDAEFSSIRYLIRHINSVHGYPAASPHGHHSRSKAL